VAALGPPVGPRRSPGGGGESGGKATKFEKLYIGFREVEIFYVYGYVYGLVE
jgi:hypothetical protein